MTCYKYSFARLIYLLAIQLPFFAVILHILLSNLTDSDFELITIIVISSLAIFISIWETLFARILIDDKEIQKHILKERILIRKNEIKEVMQNNHKTVITSVIGNKIVIHREIVGYSDICKKITEWHDIKYSGILPAFIYNPVRPNNQDTDKLNRMYKTLLIALFILAVILTLINIFYK